MLELLPKVPKHRKEAGEARKLLKKLRRAAGNVRDIDVQIDLIAELAPEGACDDLKTDAEKLREKLKNDREDDAKKLRKVLKKRQTEATLALERLLEALEPVEKFALTATQLSDLVESWYRKNVPPETGKTKDDPEYLHTIRKVAKLARYIAENAPESAKGPRKLAQEFESLQQSGGEWHDWLVLEEISRKTVGKSSPLTTGMARRNRLSLTAYQRHLEQFSE
jgi:CHAD domain-containing protein